MVYGGWERLGEVVRGPRLCNMAFHVVLCDDVIAQVNKIRIHLLVDDVIRKGLDPLHSPRTNSF